MKFGAIVIGDEILSGKRQDKHMPKVIEALGARGLELAWCEYIGDDPARIVRTLERTFQSGERVFSFGGIGATPDDHTRQCAAKAARVELVLHPDAEAEIRARFGDEITPKRLQMGEFPEGSAIIPNPYNRIPGFSLHEHYFVPGFPQMAWPMMEWVLDHRYAHLCAPGRVSERSIIVTGCGESQLIDLMNECLARYPACKVFSLPRVQPQRHVELGVRGDAMQVPVAILELQKGVTALGFEWLESAGASERAR